LSEVDRSWKRRSSAEREVMTLFYAAQPHQPTLSSSMVVIIYSISTDIIIILVIFLTDFTDLNLYCIKGALALFVLVSFSGYVC